MYLIMLLIVMLLALLYLRERHRCRRLASRYRTLCDLLESRSDENNQYPGSDSWNGRRLP